MSKTRKFRTRLRLKAVDDVISTVQNSGVSTHSLVRLSVSDCESEPELIAVCWLQDKSTCSTDGSRDETKGQIHDFLSHGPRLSERVAQGAQV